MLHLSLELKLAIMLCGCNGNDSLNDDIQYYDGAENVEKDFSISLLSDETFICNYDFDLSNDEHFINYHNLIFVENIIEQKLSAFGELRDQTGIEEYLCQISTAISTIPDDINGMTIEEHLSSEIEDLETVNYMVQTIDALFVFAENNTLLFEHEEEDIACILETEFNNLNETINGVSIRNPCIPNCNQIYSNCENDAYLAGGAVMAAGTATAGVILAYGWYTGAAAGVGAMGSFAGGVFGGLGTIGVGIYQCTRDLRNCLRTCNGGDDDEEDGPIPFGKGGC